MAEESLVALVSGANRGIGLEVVRQLAGRGMIVILGSRDPEQGQEAADTLSSKGLDVRAWQLDVADAESAGKVAGSIEQEFGRLDVLVNNAGISLDDGQSGGGGGPGHRPGDVGGEPDRGLAAVRDFYPAHAPERIWPYRKRL